MFQQRSLYALTTLCLLFCVVSLLNSCTADKEPLLAPGCDLDSVSYTATVRPILQANCLGCHNAAVSSAGINLDGYDQLMIYVSNGSLMGSVEHLSGFSPMPKNRQKLITCDIDKLRQWIANGAPNN